MDLCNRQSWQKTFDGYNTHKINCTETPMADLMQVAEDFIWVIFEKEVTQLGIFLSRLPCGRWHHELDGTSDAHVLLLAFIQQARHLPALPVKTKESWRSCHLFIQSKSDALKIN